jgi:hypothetical protein
LKKPSNHHSDSSDLFESDVNTIAFFFIMDKEGKMERMPNSLLMPIFEGEAAVPSDGTNLPHEEIVVLANDAIFPRTGVVNLRSLVLESHEESLRWTFFEGLPKSKKPYMLHFPTPRSFVCFFISDGSSIIRENA